jgi:hypothetical protein
VSYQRRSRQLKSRIQFAHKHADSQLGIDLGQSGKGHSAPSLFRQVLEGQMATANHEHDNDIRARAWRMWREAGSPKGREPEYLERARELQVFVDHPDTGLLPKPMPQHPHPDANEEPIEEAELLENLSEFPGGRIRATGFRHP